MIRFIKKRHFSFGRYLTLIGAFTFTVCLPIDIKAAGFDCQLSCERFYGLKHGNNDCNVPSVYNAFGANCTPMKTSPSKDPSLGDPTFVAGGNNDSPIKANVPSSAAESFGSESKLATDGAAKLKADQGSVEKALVLTDDILRKRLGLAKTALQTKPAGNVSSMRNPESGSDSGGTSPTPNAAILHDAPILNRAMVQYDNEKPISVKDVSSAVIPDVRENLLAAAKAQEIAGRLAKNDAELQDELLGLLNIASLALQRGQSLSEVSDSNSKLVSNKAVPQNSNSTKALIAKGESSEETESAVSAKERAFSIEKLTEAIAKLKSPKDSALRERLRKRLAEARAAKLEDDTKAAALKSASGSGIFEGKLSAEGAAVAVDTTKGAGASLAAQVVDSALKSSNAADQERFSLAGPETDAAVRKLMRDPSSPENGDLSVQAADSPSLFDRVHSAHTNCLKSHCVN